MKKVKFNDLKTQLKPYEEEIHSAILSVLSSNNFILGKQVESFEKMFANYLGVRYCVGVGNGTDALEIALRSIGVKKNSVVATVANAGMYTTSALNIIGAKPFYLDVNCSTYNVTMEEVVRALEAKVDAIVITHLFGLCVHRVEEIAALCKENGVPLVEDCAQSHGAVKNHRLTGTFGDVSTFSFYPTKNLGAIGDAGAVATNSEKIDRKIRSLRQYGWNKKYVVSQSNGRNSRMDEIQAAVLSTMLPKLESRNIQRRKIATYYSKNIKNSKIIVPSEPGKNFVAHLFVIRTKNRSDLKKMFAANSIETAIHYPIPDHFQKGFENRPVDGSLANTELLCNEVLSLPCYPEMDFESVEKITELANSW